MGSDARPLCPIAYYEIKKWTKNWEQRINPLIPVDVKNCMMDQVGSGAEKRTDAASTVTHLSAPDEAGVNGA